MGTSRRCRLSIIRAVITVSIGREKRKTHALGTNGVELIFYMNNFTTVLMKFQFLIRIRFTPLSSRRRRLRLRRQNYVRPQKKKKRKTRGSVEIVFVVVNVSVRCPATSRITIHQRNDDDDDLVFCSASRFILSSRPRPERPCRLSLTHTATRNKTYFDRGFCFCVFFHVPARSSIERDRFHLAGAFVCTLS